METIFILSLQSNRQIQIKKMNSKVVIKFHTVTDMIVSLFDQVEHCYG